MSAGAQTAAAAAVMDRLTAAGLAEAAMPGWWRTPRAELGGLAPEDALGVDQQRVLALADTDAQQFPAGWGRRAQCTGGSGGRMGTTAADTDEGSST